MPILWAFLDFVNHSERLTMTTHVPLAFAFTWAKSALADAHKAFAKTPNATNWDVLQRAALTYQQAEFANRSVSVDRAKLSFDLAQNPMGIWQDVICRATVGSGVRDALRDCATL